MNWSEDLSTKPGVTCSTQVGRTAKTEDPGPFWRLIDQSGGPGACWPWTGYRDKDGYGTHTKGRRANRVACEAGHGPPPFVGAKALHSCDNPPCCNPAHLSWGTQKRNYDESVERGRHINTRPKRAVSR